MVKVFFNRELNKVNKSEPMLLNVLYTYISASILPPISNASKDLRMVSSSSVPIVKIMRWLVEMKDRKTRYIMFIFAESSFQDMFDLLPPAIFSAKSVTICVKLTGPGDSESMESASPPEMDLPTAANALTKSSADKRPFLSQSIIPKASLNS